MLRRILTRLTLRLLLSLLVFGGAGAILFFGTMRFGLVNGEEFAPDSFQRREYWYYELPLIRLKITPIFRKVQQQQLEKMLVSKQYISPKTPPTRWDLVQAFRGGEPWCRGDAWILCAYLDAWDSNNGFTSFWETWTNNHPALAKIVWPEVAKLARRNLYLLIPPLLDEVQRHNQPASFHSDLNGLLARNYHMLGETEAELGRLEPAIAYFSDALQYDQGHRASLLGRAACYEALGKSTEARRDRAEAATAITAEAEDTATTAEPEDAEPEDIEPLP